MFKNPIWQGLFVSVLFLTTSGLAFFAIITPSPLTPPASSLVVGQVASQDIVAPRSVTFDSKILTEQERGSVLRAIQPVYTTLDTSIARRQMNHLRDVLAYISSVRSDNYPSQEQKLEDLSALEDIQFQTDIVKKILALSDTRWQGVQQETINVLEQVMRTTIRDNQLEDSRRGVPAIISLSLPEDQAAIVSELVKAYIAPNSQYSEPLTEAARQQARDQVKNISRSYVLGETIISRGRLITALDIEALQTLGLTQPTKKWQDYLGTATLVLVIIIFCIVYLRKLFVVNHPRMLGKRALFVLSVLFLGFLYTARLVIPGDELVAYLFPLSAYSLTLAALFGSELAIISILPLALLVTYGIPNTLELTMYHVLGTMFGIFFLGRAQRISSFLGASVVSAFTGLLVVVAYRFLESPDAPAMIISRSFQREMILLGSAAIGNSISSAGLTIVLQFILAQFLGVISPLHLVELSRPDHPLLRLLMQSASGSYQHSLQVANLSEQAAERVNANGLLARVGALYHDVGKIRNPAFFIENQVPGQLNPHDDLDPADSATIIIAHVPDGLKLARKYRLPRRILSFILEHHGGSLTRYQYVSAVKAAGGDENQVDKNKYRYPGHRPQTRETGIVMLADGCEAAARAKRPNNEDDLRIIIENIIDSRLKEHLLDDTELTLNDLSKIKETFVETLKGVYHPRIDYPKLDKPPDPPITIEDVMRLPLHEPVSAKISTSVSSTEDTERIR